MSLSQPNIWNVVSLHPQDPNGQGSENYFILGPNTRTYPDNDAGFRIRGTTSVEAPCASFLSTTTELRMPVHSTEPDQDQYQNYQSDRVPYEKGSYAPPAAPPLFFWPTESHGLPLAGPFDNQNIHLLDSRGQVVDTWPFLPPGIPASGGAGGTATETAEAHARGVNREDRHMQDVGEEGYPGGGGGGGGESEGGGDEGASTIGSEYAI